MNFDLSKYETFLEFVKGENLDIDTALEMVEQDLKEME